MVTLHARARRTDENAGYFRMSAALPEGFPGLTRGPDTIAVSGASIRPVIRGIHKRLFQLDPPARIRWATLFDEPVRGRAHCLCADPLVPVPYMVWS